MKVITKEQIEQAISSSPFKDGDQVRIKASGKTGTVRYVYYNGFALVDTGEKVTGGILNNDSTYRWNEIEKI